MIVYCDFITAVLLHNLPYLSITRTKNQYKYYFYVQEILYCYYLKTMKIKCSDLPELCPEQFESSVSTHITFQKASCNAIRTGQLI